MSLNEKGTHCFCFGKWERRGKSNLFDVHVTNFSVLNGSSIAKSSS